MVIQTQPKYQPSSPPPPPSSPPPPPAPQRVIHNVQERVMTTPQRIVKDPRILENYIVSSSPPQARQEISTHHQVIMNEMRRPEQQIQYR